MYKANKSMSAAIAGKRNITLNIIAIILLFVSGMLINTALIAPETAIIASQIFCICCLSTLIRYFRISLSISIILQYTLTF